VNSLMRRTIFLALLAALLIAPAARAADDPTTIEIQRDCADDSTLQGDYTVTELRKARSALPTDADEYSDCRDVLTRAITKATAASKTPTPTATPAGGGSSGSSGGGSTGSNNGSGGSTDTSQAEQDQAILSAPSSPQDAAAVGAAAADGEKAIKAELVQRSPDKAQLAASVGRNGLPTTMIAVLVLIAATLVAALMPLIRRRRVFPFHPRT
jgi:cobalamin biosynthesis Mg chelatase CobN